VADTATSAPEITLRVIEGHPEDAGTGCVRIDPVAFQQLQLVIGDVVRLTGKKTTVARAIPLAAENAGSGLIQLDGVIRGNTGIGVDEKVAIGKASARSALSVVLSPVDTSRSFSREDDLKLLHKSILGVALVAGDLAYLLVLGLFGTFRNPDFALLWNQFGTRLPGHKLQTE
jgi:transitional endoplasmic reticulum ATPase